MSSQEEGIASAAQITDQGIFIGSIGLKSKRGKVSWRYWIALAVKPEGLLSYRVPRRSLLHNLCKLLISWYLLYLYG